MNVALDLTRPEAYPPTVRSGIVTRLETHLSWVFLLARDVFKVKKAVNLGFVDFTTLERRKAACDAEVVLNARLAPGVYLGVVPIVQTRDGLRVEEHGAPVEWAVHMRRLADESRADQLLGRVQLSGELVGRMADCIAAFHAAARCDETTTQFGTPEQIGRNVYENFAQTAQALREVLSEPEAREVTAYQASFLAEHAPTFAERMASGRVRDTHGDLRLEHVYFEEPNAVRVIDCIEFSDRFRYADVCADIAFLSMDLAVRGRADLAERLLARYARESQDYDLYALVDFYESYRAFVRGKVEMLVGADPHVAEDARRRARSSARRHFLFALAAGRPSSVPPFLLAVGGLVAAGKTTIAERLGERLGVVVVGSDRTRKHLRGVSAGTSLADQPFEGAYAPERSAEVYSELRRRAAVVLSSGRPVIVDASFRGEHDRQRLRHLATEHDAPFLFAECRCSEGTARARLGARGQGSVSDARVDLFDVIARDFEPVRLPAAELVVVDTDGPLDRNLEDLVARLTAAERGRAISRSAGP